MVGLNLSIRGRLCLGFAIVLSMLVVLSAFSISRVQNIVRNLSVMNDINCVKQRYAINFRGSVHDRAIALRDVSLAVTPGEAQVASDNIERLGSNYAKSAAPLDAMMASGQQVTDEEQSILGSIKATEAKTLPIIADVLQKKRSGDEAGAKAVLMGSAKPLFVEWLKEINQFIDLEEAKNKAIGANARAIAESFFLYTVLLATAALALGSVVAIWAVRGLNPLKRLTSVIGRLAAGDFTAEVPDVERKDEVGAIAQAVQVFKSTGIERVRLELQANQHKQEIDTKLREVQAAFESAGRNQKAIVEDLATCLGQLAAKDLTISLNHDTAPEYGRLKQDFNSAVLSLRETMTSVLSSSSSLDVGSAEISMACDDLSRRTEQQAASLAETSAALAEITNTVRRTAEGAHHAREVVDIARVGATKSGEIVAQAVAAMGEIERSAHEISQIISVIDEIAFQTNLLALNAGVEAARAGDAGRGFAVVASEVRALAQRSAEAAREIKALISTSSAQVKQGVYLVGETGTALTQIVTQVAEINGIVGGIAASAQEQAAGLDQVNTAVSQMDHVTQQNAAMVEQTTAASHAFATEVLGLTRLVSQFEIGSDAVRHRDGMRPAIALAKRSTKKNDVLPGKSMLQPVRQKFVVNGTTGSASEASWEEF